MPLVPVRSATLGAVAASLLALPAAAQQNDRWGPPVDVQAYAGLYDDAEGRSWFVAEAEPPPGSDMPVPGGHLMIGATFGDVAPWYLQTISETEFFRPGYNEYNPDITVTFELGADGHATALTYTRGDDAPQTWDRSGELPEARQ